MYQYEKAHAYCKSSCNSFFDYLEIENYGPIKGRGVKTNKFIPRGDFICEYKGVLRERSNIDANEDESYHLHFMFNDTWWVIDATEEKESFGLGRLINHSRSSPNIKPKVILINGRAHVCFFAIKDILAGSELLYDYGDDEASVDWIND